MALQHDTLDPLPAYLRTLFIVIAATDTYVLTLRL